MLWMFRKKFKRFKRHPPVNSNNNIRNSAEAFYVGFEHAPGNSPIIIHTSHKKHSMMASHSKRQKLPPQNINTGTSQITQTRKDVKVSRVHFKSGDPCESIDMNKLNEYYPIIKSTSSQNKNHPKTSISTSVIEDPKQSKLDLKTGKVIERSCDSIHPKRTENKRKTSTHPIERKFTEPKIIKLQVPLKCLMDSNDDFSKSERKISFHAEETPKPIERIKMIKIFPPVPKRSFMKTDITVPVPLPRVKVNKIIKVPNMSSRKPNAVIKFEENEQHIQNLEFGDSMSSLSSYPSEVGRHIQQNRMLKFIKKNQTNYDEKLFDQETELAINKIQEPKTPKNSLISFRDEAHPLDLQRSDELTVIYECKDTNNKVNRFSESKTSKKTGVKMESYIEKGNMNPSIIYPSDVLQLNSSNSVINVIWETPQALTPRFISSKIPSNPEIRKSIISSKSKSTEACMMAKRQSNANKLRTIKSQIVPVDKTRETNSNTMTPESSHASSEDNFKTETKIDTSCCGHNNKSKIKSPATDARPHSDSKPKTLNKTSSTSPLPKQDASCSTQTEICYQLKCTEPLSNEMIDVNIKLPTKYSNVSDSVNNSSVDSSCNKSSKITLMSQSPDSLRFGENQQMKNLFASPDIITNSTNEQNRISQEISKPKEGEQSTNNGTKLVPIPQVLYAHAYRDVEFLNYDKISSRIVQSLQGTQFNDFPRSDELRNLESPIYQPAINKNEVTRSDAHSNLNFHCDHGRENNRQSKEEMTPRPINISCYTSPLNDSETHDFPSDKVIKEVTSFHKDSLIEVNKLSANIQRKFNFMKSINSKPFDISTRRQASGFDSGQYFAFLSEQLEKSGDQIKSSRNPFPSHDRTRSPAKSCLSYSKSRTQIVDSEKHWHERLSPENLKHFSKHSQSPPCNFRSPKFHDGRETVCRNVEMRSKCRYEDLDNISEDYSEESLCSPGSCASQSICKSNTTPVHHRKSHNFSFPNFGCNSARCGRCSRNSPKMCVVMQPTKSSSRNSHRRHQNSHYHKHGSPLARSEPQMSGSALFRAAAHVTKEFTSANLGRKKLKKSTNVSERIEELKRILSEGFRSKKCSRSHCPKEKVIRVQNRDDCQHNIHNSRQYIIEPLSRNSKSKRDNNTLRERMACKQNRDDCCQHGIHNRQYYLEPISFNDLKSDQYFQKGSIHNMYRENVSESSKFFQRDFKRHHHHHHHHQSSPSKSLHRHLMHGVSPCMHGRNNPPKNWKDSQQSYFDLTSNNVRKSNCPSPVWRIIR